LLADFRFGVTQGTFCPVKIRSILENPDLCWKCSDLMLYAIGENLAADEEPNTLEDFR